MPAGDQISMLMMDGTTLRREGWVAWREEALRVTQEFSLMQEFYEECPSANRI